MYAIVDIAGQQFKVEKDQKIFVHRLEGKEGSKISFDQVLLVDNDGKVTVGSPVVSGMVVSATIQAHVKADKVMVFKKKRRKGYQTLNGHRQFMTELLIENIGSGTVKAAPKAKAKPEVEATKPAAKAKPTTAKATPKAKAEAKPAAKKAPAKAKASTEAKPKAAPAKKAAAKPKAASTAKPKAAAKPKKTDDKKSENK